MKKRYFCSKNNIDYPTIPIKKINNQLYTYSRTFINRTSNETDVNNFWGDFYGIIYILIDKNKDQSLDHEMYYIGGTIRNLRRRFLEHIRTSDNKYLQGAFDRYIKKFEVISIDETFSQTDRGEFTIQVIDYTTDLIDHCIKEKYYIELYKTYVYDYFILEHQEIKPLYGYNLTRGGTGLPALYGFLNPRYIHVPEDELKKMIKLGYFTQDIANEFKIGYSTVNSKIEELWGDIGIKTINSARRAFGGWMPFKIRGHIDVDLEKLIVLIEQGLFHDEICEKLKINNGILYRRLNSLGIKDLTEARFLFGAMDVYQERLYKRHLEYALRGIESYQFVFIPMDPLKNHIEKGMDEYKIAELYHTTNVTVRERVREYWDLTFYEAQLLFRIFKRINEPLLHVLLNNLSTFQEIERLFFIKLISEGHSPTTISKLFEFKGHSAISQRIAKSLEMTFIDSKVEYYYKPRIIECFKNGDLNSVEISQKLKETRVTINSVIKKIWHKEYEDLKDIDYTDNSPRQFINLFQFLIRLYKIYPSIDKVLLNNCLYKNFTPKEIDSAFCRYYNLNNYEI